MCVFHKNTMVLASSSASSTKTQRFQCLLQRLPQKHMGSASSLVAGSICVHVYVLVYVNVYVYVRMHVRMHTTWFTNRARVSKKGIVFWHSPFSPTPLKYNVERVLTFARPLAKSENDLLNIVFLGARGAQWLYVSSASACKKTIPFFGQGGWLYKTIRNIMTGDAFLLFYALRWKLRAVTCSNSRDCVLGHLLWKHEWHTVYIYIHIYF